MSNKKRTHVIPDIFCYDDHPIVGISKVVDMVAPQGQELLMFVSYGAD